MGKEVGELVAARFLQIVNVLQMALDLQLSAELPFFEWPHDKVSEVPSWIEEPTEPNDLKWETHA